MYHLPWWINERRDIPRNKSPAPCLTECCSQDRANVVNHPRTKSRVLLRLQHRGHVLRREFADWMVTECRLDVEAHNIGVCRRGLRRFGWHYGLGYPPVEE